MASFIFKVVLLLTASSLTLSMLTSANKGEIYPPRHEPPPSPSPPPPSPPPPPPRSPPPPPPPSPSPPPPPSPSPPPQHYPPPTPPASPPPQPKPQPPPKYPHPHPHPRPEYLSLSVKGAVFCQSCTYVGSKSLIGATPLKGANVELVCKNGRYSSRTGRNGDYNFYVRYFDFRRYNPVQSCAVLLTSSGSGYCSRPTFINYSRYGAMLRFDGKGGATMFYSAKPLAFAPPPCYKPKPKPYPKH
ncbi:hypothetical protein KP509_36G063000 [Ceratopteris richardii]|uniref:Pistil-specific extensin-like protein n=1 Tax=Ceratopteris richardii TaxID=49495 RepID=A0A8T2QCL3_CERRI|nr:hypothetical protein KP509_36G063000 [Ceratopteris richardii]